MQRTVMLLMGLFLAGSASAQIDMRRELERKFEAGLARINDDFDGVFGAQFVDLTDGRKVSLNADVIFPSASTIKVPILIELFRQADKNPEILKKQRPFVTDARTSQSGMGRLLGVGSALAVEDIAKMMINLSENASTNLIIDEVGMDNVNRLISSLGLTQTMLQRKMLDSVTQARGGDNLSSPADGAAIMTKIAQCELPVSKASCDRMRQILEIPQDPHPAKDAIPRNIPIAFKWGGLEGVSAGWAIVNLPDRPYAFAIMTSFGEDNAKAVRAASELGFHYFSRLARSTDAGARVPLDVIRRERPPRKP